MPSTLTQYSERFRLDEEALRRHLTCPVVLWNAGSEAYRGDAWLPTTSMSRRDVASASDLFVFEVHKALENPNPFSGGVTVGRIDSNDVVLPHASVSRFHAFFHEPSPAVWALVDAESKNGTYVAGVRLLPGRPTLLGVDAEMRFGDVEVQFLQPSAFLAVLARANAH